MKYIFELMNMLYFIRLCLLNFRIKCMVLVFKEGVEIKASSWGNEHIKSVIEKFSSRGSIFYFGDHGWFRDIEHFLESSGVFSLWASIILILITKTFSKIAFKIRPIKPNNINHLLSSLFPTNPMLIRQWLKITHSKAYLVGINTRKIQGAHTVFRKIFKLAELRILQIVRVSIFFWFWRGRCQIILEEMVRIKLLFPQVEFKEREAFFMINGYF